MTESSETSSAAERVISTPSNLKSPVWKYFGFWFLFILMIIGTAFLCGVNNIYVPYIISPRLGRFNETFHFLFWTMFGVANQDYVDMPEFMLAEFVGRMLYGIFTLVIVIVLLNMLVAMITNSFQKIEDDADVEWKFARSKLYLSYFREGLTMPAPFNIIPSPKVLFYLLRGIFRKLSCCCNFNQAPDYPPIASMSNADGVGESRLPYRLQVINALVQRYIETARREFEESKRKNVGNRITQLNKLVGNLHSEMKQMHQCLLKATGSQSADTALLTKYIAGAKNNFRGFSSKGEMGSSNIPLSIAALCREDGKREGKEEGQEEEKTPVEDKETASSSTNSERADKETASSSTNSERADKETASSSTNSERADKETASSSTNSERADKETASSSTKSERADKEAASSSTNSERADKETASSPTNSKRADKNTVSFPTNSKSEDKETASSPTNSKREDKETVSSPTNSKKEDKTTVSSPTNSKKEDKETVSSPTNSKKEDKETVSSPTNSKSSLDAGLGSQGDLSSPDTETAVHREKH